MAEKSIKKRVPMKKAADRPEAVEPGDFIEYGITLEIQPQPGQKAWIKFGTTSQVREGESTGDAVRRVAQFVEDGLDERIEQQSE